MMRCGLWLWRDGTGGLCSTLAIGVVRWEQSIMAYSCEPLVLALVGSIRFCVLCLTEHRFPHVLLRLLGCVRELGMVWHAVLLCITVVRCLFAANFLLEVS